MSTTRVGDTLLNLTSGLGVIGTDKAASAGFGLNIMQEAEINAAYRGEWIARNIVDIPAEDMVRAWRTFQIDKKDIGAVEAEERRLGVRAKFGRAVFWARLYGGAALILDDGAGDLMRPLSVTGKGGLQRLLVVPKQRCTAGPIQWDPYDPDGGFDLPIHYNLSGGQRGSVEVHPTRVITFMGSALPDDTLGDGNSKVYGESILIAVRDAVLQASSSNAGIASLIEEAKIDIIKVNGLLAQAINKEFRDQVMARWQLAAVMKSLNSVMLIDQNETWERKQIAFSNLPETAQHFLSVAAAAARMPVTKFLGRSPQGMNATGDGDAQNYDGFITTRQDIDLSPRIDQLDAVLLVSALGTAPKASSWSKWNPLRVPSPEENDKRRQALVTVVKTISDTGLVPTAALETSFQNALIEEGFLPGLEEAIEEAKKGLLLPFQDPASEGNDIDPSTGQPYADDDPRNPKAQAQRQQEESAKPRTLRLVAGDRDGTITVQAPQGGKVRDAKPRTLYVSRPLVNGDELDAWAKANGFETTVGAGQMHVTIAYSRQPIDWMAVGEDWSFAGDNGDLIVPPGGARLVEPLGGKGAVVLLFSSGNLGYRHRQFLDAGASWDFDGYQPHVTITWNHRPDLDLAKVEPFRGPLRFGPEVWEEIVEDWKDTLQET